MGENRANLIGFEVLEVKINETSTILTSVTLSCKT